MHGLNLAAYGDKGPTRQGLAMGIDDALHVATHAAEVAVLRCPVDIGHAAYVVVIDDGDLAATLHRSNIRKNLRTAFGASRDGNILDIRDRLDSVLRGLRNQVVVHAVLPVDEEVWRDLEAPAQRVQHARSNVFFLVSRLQCLGPVHVHIKRWVVEWLLDVQVGQPGHLVQIRHDLLGDFVIRLNVASFNLDVNRRGQAEIQNLGHDVRRRKIESGPWELPRKLSTKNSNIISGGGMVPAQRHQHIGIVGSNHARGGVHQVIGTEWQADVVENAVDFFRRHFLANGRLYQVCKLRRILNACPGLRADMEAELTAIRIREEVLSEPRRQEKCAEAEREKCWNQDLASHDQTSQQSFLRTADSGEALLKCPLNENKRIARLALPLA